MNTRAYRVTSLLVAVILGVSFLASSFSSPHPAFASETPELKRALLATVEIVVPIDGQRDMASSGSGSILSPDGYILTNYHVMADTDTGDLYNKDGTAAIAINNADSLHSMPTFLYQAKLVKDDPDLDLAVLKIVKPLNNKGNLPDNLGLTTMPLGDSSKVEFDDGVRCLGYPGIGGDSVTFTKGSISGFLDKAADGSPLWFKSDAQLNHGNSGGAAINDKGEMIGVPSRISTDVEAAGKIALIRPINLAKGLIKAAMANLSTDPPPAQGTGARLENLVFTDAVDRQGRPGVARTRFDPGTKIMYAVFDFSGFEDGQSFEYEWLRDGQSIWQDTFDWSQGAEGSSWVSLSNDSGLVKGSYEVKLSLDGQELLTGKVLIGTPSRTQSPPQFGEITFAENVDDQDLPIKPHGANEPFASNVTNIYAFFDYKNMPQGTPYTYTWTCDGEEMLTRDKQWEATDNNGTHWLNINSSDGLPDGQWRLALSINGQKANEGQFTIGGGTPPVEGVQLTGQIIDADTKRPINGASMVVLNQGISANDFLNDPQESMVFAWGLGDRQGRFRLDKLLERGQTYVLVAGAKNYQPVVEGNFEVAQDAESSIDLTVQLQKR